MAPGRKATTGELLSSDDEDADRAEQPSLPAAKALLEREVPAAPSPRPAAPSPRPAKEEKEGVFEIRDFTTASSFERIAHQITLAAKKWAGLLKSSPADEEGLLLKEEFDHMEFKYELLFQFMHKDPSVPPAACGGPGERLGLHTFPSRAHRMTRWFGVNHFVIVSVRGQNIDVDSARTVLSAMVLAAQSVAALLPQPLSCFVPVEGGRRRRYLGELLSGGRRTLYTTDLDTSVQRNLEHLEGLSHFFFHKLGIDRDDVPTVGVRFTYLADAFDPMDWALAQGSSAADGANTTPEGATLDRDETDPVDTMQLHCLWPSFPEGSFVDNATFSELDPKHAPYWKLRVMRTEGAPLPLSKLLRNLLEFRKEARTVRSAEHSVQPQVPKTALASLTCAIQESLESILLPTPGEMKEQVRACLICPLAAAPSPESLGAKLQAAGLRGGVRGSRMAKFAELSAKMRCFKGSVMLWCQVLAQMRQQWETASPPLESEVTAPTQSVSARGVRTEFFDSAVCLVQQKFEMLNRCVSVRRAAGVAAFRRAEAPTVPGRSVPEGLQIEATGVPIVAPQLCLPALMTEDMVVQQDMASASIAEPVERAELHRRELKADMAAFKAANQDATLRDFCTWRTEVERLSLEPFPQEWLESLWSSVEAQPAAEQSGRLFEPNREAEMALHYLENIDGTQLLLQVFRVQLRACLEELACMSGNENAYLRVLKDRALALCLTAFSPAGREEAETGMEEEADAVAAATVGDDAVFPSEEALQDALTALEALEGAARLAASLRVKLPGVSESLIEELVAESEAGVTCPAQRKLVEALFERGRVLAQGQGREPLDGKGVFESLPLAKEFVIQLQSTEAGPVTGLWRRLYAEVRERHLRLAISKSFRMM